VELAALYNEEGADELVFYDITASAESEASLWRWFIERRAGVHSSHGRRRRSNDR